MTKYEYPNEKGNVLGDFTFTVVGVSGTTTFCEADYFKIKRLDIIPFAVYVENYTDIASTVENMGERYFSFNASEGQAIQLLNRSVTMFFDLFRLIEVVTLGMAAVFLVSHSVRSVKRNYYQIGVIKAIGGRNSDISLVFVLENVLISAVIALITFFGSISILNLANKVLVRSFMEITDIGIASIHIIRFDLGLVLATVGVTFLVNLVFTVVPLMLLYNVKPIDIIKAKE